MVLHIVVFKEGNWGVRPGKKMVGSRGGGWAWVGVGSKTDSPKRHTLGFEERKQGLFVWAQQKVG